MSTTHTHTYTHRNDRKISARVCDTVTREVVCHQRVRVVYIETYRTLMAMLPHSVASRCQILSTTGYGRRMWIINSIWYPGLRVSFSVRLPTDPETMAGVSDTADAVRHRFITGFRLKRDQYYCVVNHSPWRLVATLDSFIMTSSRTCMVDGSAGC